MKDKLPASKRITALQYGVAALIGGDRKSAGVCFGAAMTGQWEGGERNRLRDRPAKRLGAQDTDLNFGKREDLTSEARSLEQTDPIVKRVKKQYADYCVGGCKLRWDTGNDAHDAIYARNWKSWMNACDYRGLHHFPKLMKIAAGEAFTPGDIFVQKVNAKGYGLLNLIEGDRVSSGGIYNNDAPDMVGGIGLDPLTRRHKFIRVWERTVYGMFQNPVEIPASDYLHLFDPTRIDAARGVTGLHAVLNALRDKKEIADAERTKTKRHSKIALLLNVATGQAPAVSMMNDEVQQTPNGVTVEETSDGQSVYQFPGEKIQALESNTPGQAWMGHMEFIIRHVALGTNLPYGVVYSMAGLNKPAVLFELQQAQRTIAAFQDEIEWRLIRPIVGWWLALEIAAKRVPFNPNWYNFTIPRPPYISIDAGRDSAAALNEVRMGMKSRADWFDEDERHWKDETDQEVTEYKYFLAKCAAEGVDPNAVRIMTPNGNPSSSSGNPKDTGGADE